MSHKKMTNFKDHQQVEFPKRTQEFLEQLIQKIPRNPRKLEIAKNHFAEINNIPTLKNRDILSVAQKNKINLPPKLAQLLQKRAVRTISGVSPIGILTKPFACPGKCIYCPTEDRMPKSYMKNQPAAARALRNNFDPFEQVKNRIIALEESGHPASKLEIIVMGGTWSFLPRHYQLWYVAHIFAAANSFDNPNYLYDANQFSTELGYEDNPQLIAGKKEGEIIKIENDIHQKQIQKLQQFLKEQQQINQTATHRIIGLTLETRPDFINEKELIRMREYGCTRIEVGVQTLHDNIQKLTKRGHTKAHVSKAMRLMKDFGFKICFHLMPGLPGSTPDTDLEMLTEVFECPDFRPDFIKIYPCMVLPTAELADIWKAGNFEPLHDKELIKILIKFRAYVPEWTRIMRLMRDIPASNILDGAKFSNLRQILQEQPKKLLEIVGEEFFEKHNLKENASKLFKDIRSREVGFSTQMPQKPVLKRRNYKASQGEEVFLSFESEDESQLFALLRLRKPSGTIINEKAFSDVLQNAGLIREVHSYGTEQTVGDGAGLGQHRGLGRKLIEEAERIVRDEWKLPQMTIIAGVGTREYYKKWEYSEKESYMIKKL